MAVENQDELSLRDIKLLLDENFNIAGVPQETGDPKMDYLKALELMNKNDVMGRWMLERLVMRSYKPAVALMSILMGAESNDPVSILALGQLYQNGQVLEKNYGKAVDCYMRLYQDDPETIRPILAELLREHRIELYVSLQKYRVLKELDQELTMEARRQKNLFGYTEQKQIEDKARRMTVLADKFQEKLNDRYQRRLDDAYQRGTIIEQKANELAQQRKKEQDKQARQLKEEIQQQALAAEEAYRRRQAMWEQRQLLRQEEYAQREEERQKLLRKREEARQKVLEAERFADETNDVNLMRALVKLYREGSQYLAPDDERCVFWQSRLEELEKPALPETAAEGAGPNTAPDQAEDEDFSVQISLPEAAEHTLAPAAAVEETEGKPTDKTDKEELSEEAAEKQMRLAASMEGAFRFYLDSGNYENAVKIVEQWHLRGAGERAQKAIEQIFSRCDDQNLLTELAEQVEVGSLCPADPAKAYQMYLKMGKRNAAEDTAARISQDLRLKSDLFGAYEWYLRSGEKKDKTGLEGHMASLAALYETASAGYPLDLPKAYELYLTAGRKTDAARVAKTLARAYILGDYGLEPSAQQSVEWQKRARQDENPWLNPK